MRRNIWLRVVLILAVTIVSVWSVYPPGEKFVLGLDLEGGAHLVLRVRTEETDPVRRRERRCQRRRPSLSRPPCRGWVRLRPRRRREGSIFLPTHRGF